MGENIPENETTEENIAENKAQKTSVSRRFSRWYGTHKKFSIPLTLLLLALILLAVPVTRYAVLSPFVRENLVVTVKDSQNQQPVSQAMVEVAGKTATTDSAGRAEIKDVPVGYQAVKITKANYKASESTVELALFTASKEVAVNFEATGRPLTVTVTDKLTKKPVANALVDAGNKITATSDSKGLATLVLPVTLKDVELAVSSKEFNKTTLKVAADKPSSVQLMPTGQVFFLSKKTGKIDVVRTNLDGSDRKTIVKGTGKERDNETSLLASRDWRYLALLANREGGKSSSVYLIDTKTNAMTLIDEGKDISTTLIGWSGHQFWYEIDRNNDYWTAKQEALKTYNADTKQLKIVDEDKSVGSEEVGAYETLDNFYIQEQGVVYTKIWNTSLLPEEYVGDDAKLISGKNHTINLATADGTKLSTLKSFSLKSPNYIGQAKLYEPRELYFQLTNDNGKNTYIEYENGQILDASVSDSEFERSYPTFLISPTGKKTLWSEPRDGKNAVFVGDAFGKNKTQLASGSEYKAYGWLTDGYLLLQKSDSELYVSTVERMKSGDAPIKISDYHKPDLNYAGYGYGYGGL